MEHETIRFEEAFAKLEAAAKTISDEKVSLQDAMQSYKEGKQYYEICSRILEEARQLIEIYDRETGEIQVVE